MIYTVTLNPAIDVYFTINEPLQEVEVNRAASQSIKAAGKGINCSLLLDTLSVPSTAVALLGGFSGAFIKEQLLHRRWINLSEVCLKEENRINMKILQKDTSLSVNASGPHIDEAVKAQLFDCLSSLNDTDFVMINGSMISGFTQSDLIALCHFIKKQNAYLIVDMECLSLALLKEIQPDLVKPNLYELSLLLKREIHKDTIQNDLNEILQHTNSILLSLGADGAIYCNKHTALRLIQQKISAVNTVGCGDALLAGFISEYANTRDVVQAMIMGGACGCAHAQDNDGSYEAIKSYFDKLTVSSIY